MRIRREVVAVVVVLAPLLVASCAKDPPAPSMDKPPMVGPKVTTAPGTDGGGDGSGTSIANARALQKAAPATFPLGCSATVYVGPFRFTKDPEKLVLQGTAKNSSTAQICVGGEWLDGAGKPIAPSGIGCADGKSTAVGKPELEYSPGNGGSGVNPVYLALRFSEPKPAGCPSIDVTLTLP